MLETDPIETVDAEPVLALDTPLTGLPAELPAHLAAELGELLADAERYAAAAHTQATGPSSKPGASATASRRSRHRPP